MGSKRPARTYPAKIYPSTPPPPPPPPKPGIQRILKYNESDIRDWAGDKVNGIRDAKQAIDIAGLSENLDQNRTGYIEEPCWRPSRVTRALFQFLRATHDTWHVICQSFSCSLFFVRPFVSTPAINLLTYKLKE